MVVAISGSQQPRVVLQIWQEKRKIDMYDFPELDCTQGKKTVDRLYFSSIVRQCKWPSVLSSTIIVIQKFCYLGNVTPHYSLKS